MKNFSNSVFLCSVFLCNYGVIYSDTGLKLLFIIYATFNIFTATKCICGNAMLQKRAPRKKLTELSISGQLG